MRRWLFALILAGFAAVAPATPGRIVIVRHAEKAAEGGDDPGLSALGQRRASALARLADEQGVTHVFTSQYRRTINTAEPGARIRKIPVSSIDARQQPALIAEVRELGASAVALIVGHSNTVAAIATELGGTGVPPLHEDEYDRVIVLTVAADGSVQTRQFTYEPGD